MAIDAPHFLCGKTALADYSSYRYRLVKTDGTVPQVAVCSAATDIPIGVLYNKPNALGVAAEVAALKPGCPVKVHVAAAGVVAGWVGTDANGELVQKTLDKAFAIGRVDQSWDDNDLATVYPMPCFIAA